MTYKKKTLVVCMDGTWQSPHNSRMRDDGSKVLKPTNVLKICRAISNRDSKEQCEQITYYDAGVGGMAHYHQLSDRILSFVDRNLGGIWGAGFESNVEDAFRFLINNYCEGDKVFLFGFSRGAAQARALTRFLSWLKGVPSKRDAYFSPLFFQHYVKTRGAGTPDDVKTSSGRGPSESLVPVSIELLGLWDTVMALGSRFHVADGTSAPDQAFHVGLQPADCVVHARQALAVDEKRYDFRPEVWNGCQTNQTLEQRWFAGCHSNVGGGLP